VRLKKERRGRRRLVQSKAVNEVDVALEVRAHSSEENTLTPCIFEREREKEKASERERERDRDRDLYFIGSISVDRS
jgi:hypothetical protein